jgi:hypothetical protein
MGRESEIGRRVTTRSPDRQAASDRGPRGCQCEGWQETVRKERSRSEGKACASTLNPVLAAKAGNNRKMSPASETDSPDTDSQRLYRLGAKCVCLEPPLARKARYGVFGNQKMPQSLDQGICVLAQLNHDLLNTQCETAPLAPNPVCDRTNCGKNNARSLTPAADLSVIEKNQIPTKAIAMENSAGYSYGKIAFS